MKQNIQKCTSILLSIVCLLFISNENAIAQCAPGETAVPFAATGATQAWIVPAGVTSITVTAIGADGGAGDPTLNGGTGATVTGTFVVAGGNNISVVVGEGGSSIVTAGGGGGGGGASGVLNTSTSTTLLVAGAGAGGSGTAGQGGQVGVAGPGTGGAAGVGAAGNWTGAGGGGGGGITSGGGAGVVGIGGTAAAGGAGGPAAAGGAGASGAGDGPGANGGFGIGGGGGGGIGDGNVTIVGIGGGGGGGGYTGGAGNTGVIDAPTGPGLTFGGLGGTSYIDASATAPSSTAGTDGGAANTGGANGSVVICFTPATPVPVNFVDFSLIQKDNNQVDVKWTTSDEVNNDYYVVEHSIDGRDFNAIGTVQSKESNSNGLHQYNWLHTNAENGKNYYRIRQVDVNGAITYTEIKTVQFGLSQDLIIDVYPNITDKNVFAKIESHRANKLNVVIINANGQIVEKTTWNIQAGVQTITVDAANWTAGLHIIKVIDGQNITQYKVLKK